MSKFSSYQILRANGHSTFMLSLCGFFFSESQSLILLKNRRNTTGHLTFVLCFGQKSRVYSNVLEEYQAGRRHNIPSTDLDSGDVRTKVGVGERKRAECRRFIHTNCRAKGYFPCSRSQPGELPVMFFWSGRWVFQSDADLRRTRKENCHS